MVSAYQKKITGKANLPNKKHRRITLHGYLGIYQYKHKHRRVVVDTTKRYFIHSIEVRVTDFAVCLTCGQRTELRRHHNYNYYLWLEHGHG